MNVISDLQNSIASALKEVFGYEENPNKVVIQITKKEFEGDYTLVTFPYTKPLKQKPEEIANMLGQYLSVNDEHIQSFSVLKGFMNLSLTSDYWKKFLSAAAKEDSNQVLDFDKKNEKILVEFASPNTNKPLHLGHIRNILLGWSMAQILEYNGYNVVKTQIVNDRGIAVCKSMYAWTKYGEGDTPESREIKGDHFVGRYYVAFDQHLKKEYKAWQSSEKAEELFKYSGNDDKEAFFKTYKNEYFNEYSEIGSETKELLRKWEAKDADTMALWKKMNQWVYDGFDVTYKALGVSFDSNYYESDTYLLGKEFVNQGMLDGVFYKKPDGSTWIDLEEDGMDHKLVLRKDGTSVYMTQDIGTANKRFEDHAMDKMVYVVGDEQDYHFKVLFKILDKLGEKYASGLHHLSYGMVELPDGKMKSREGTVVDADDLIAEIIQEARDAAEERGEMSEKSEAERNALYQQIGMAALKFFMLKVHARKGMTFDPKESVDMQGQTGPYIQNAFVRIQSVLRKADELELDGDVSKYHLETLEKEILREVAGFKHVIDECVGQYDPSGLANYCYTLGKMYHKFYHDHRILTAESPEAMKFRVDLSALVGKVLKTGMNLLGIDMPNYM